MNGCKTKSAVIMNIGTFYKNEIIQRYMELIGQLAN